MKHTFKKSEIEKMIKEEVERFVNNLSNNSEEEVGESFKYKVLILSKEISKPFAEFEVMSLEDAVECAKYWVEKGYTLDQKETSREVLKAFSDNEKDINQEGGGVDYFSSMLDEAAVANMDPKITSKIKIVKAAIGTKELLEKIFEMLIESYSEANIKSELASKLIAAAEHYRKQKGIAPGLSEALGEIEATIRRAHKDLLGMLNPEEYLAGLVNLAFANQNPTIRQQMTVFLDKEISTIEKVTKSQHYGAPPQRR